MCSRLFLSLSCFMDFHSFHIIVEIGLLVLPFDSYEVNILRRSSPWFFFFFSGSHYARITHYKCGVLYPKCKKMYVSAFLYRITPAYVHRHNILIK